MCNNVAIHNAHKGPTVVIPGLRSCCLIQPITVKILKRKWLGRKKRETRTDVYLEAERRREGKRRSADPEIAHCAGRSKVATKSTVMGMDITEAVNDVSVVLIQENKATLTRPLLQQRRYENE